MLPFPEYTNMENGARNMAHFLPKARTQTRTCMHPHPHPHLHLHRKP
jgi:hypothetical protein